MKVNDWVNGSYNRQQITGFIMGIDKQHATVYVTTPNYGPIVVPLDDIWEADSTIWPDDIPALIDLSLAIRDKEWFQKWVHELSLWKPVEEVGFLSSNSNS